jgi:hypothetical protein
MLIDCDICVVRGAACHGCLVSAVLGAPPSGVELDPAERRAVEVLADAGMVPRLRLLTAEPARPPSTPARPPSTPAAAAPAGDRARRVRRIA